MNSVAMLVPGASRSIDARQGPGRCKRLRRPSSSRSQPTAFPRQGPSLIWRNARCVAARSLRGMEGVTALGGWLMVVVGTVAVLGALIIAALLWLLTHPLD